MATIIKPPAPIPDTTPSLFLAGSIDLGVAVDWQTDVQNSLADLDILILNPRRDEWDATWKQSFEDSLFRSQVEWELGAQERATMIAMYFAPTTKAPITLLELGLFARSGNLVVCVPDGYWRKGNVEVVCFRYGIPMVDDLAALISAVRERFG